VHCSSTFCFLRLVSAVLSRPQSGWSAISMFPSLKCLTHVLKLLAPMQAPVYTPQSRLWFLPIFPFSQKFNCCTLTKRRWEPFSRNAWGKHKRWFQVGEGKYR
jgi:hypothetical protein